MKLGQTEKTGSRHQGGSQGYGLVAMPWTVPGGLSAAVDIICV
jgi:hypothetical protein